MSNEILDRMSDSYRRIRNTARYLLSAINDFDPAIDSVEPEQMLALDRWAVDCTAKTQEAVEQAFHDYNFHAVYQHIHNFCAVDMSSFYLDIIKDRQYTMPATSQARRSTQTAMYLMTEALVRWISPVLSFTSDEIWQHIPGTRSDTVFTETWYDRLFQLNDDDRLSADDWAVITDTRAAVSKELERLRVDGDIGGSVDADITLYCDGARFDALNKLDDELRFVLITSSAVVKPIDQRRSNAVEVSVGNDTMYIDASGSPEQKCIRCWHHRSDVGSDSSHPELCHRCVENISGEGETRLYA